MNESGSISIGGEYSSTGGTVVVVLILAGVVLIIFISSIVTCSTGKSKWYSIL